MNLVPQRTSLVGQVALVLKEGIRTGRWTGHLPGEMTLCRHLQVSRVTLRAALRQLHREKWCSSGQGRRRAIFPGREEHRKKRASSVVVMLSPLELQDLPASAIFWIDGLRGQLAAVGCNLEFLSCPAVYRSNPRTALENLVRTTAAAGWVLYLSTEPLQRWFSERGLPCVICGSRYPKAELPSLDINYAATCAHAAGLLMAHSRTRLALLMPCSQQAGNLESERAFLQAAEKHPKCHATIAHHDGTVAGICRTLDRLLDTPAADGLLVAKPAHVVTAVTHLLRRSVRLPQDLSLISRDDDPLLEHLVPEVTRYQAEGALFARTVSRFVLKLIRNGASQRLDWRMTPKLFRGETL